MKKSLLLILCFALVLTGCGQTTGNPAPPTPAPPEDIIAKLEITLPDGVVEGLVVDVNNRTIANAIIRLQATDIFTTSNSEGFFHLDEMSLKEPQSFTAWHEGYFINNVIAKKGEQFMQLLSNVALN